MEKTEKKKAETCVEKMIKGLKSLKAEELSLKGNEVFNVPVFRATDNGPVQTGTYEVCPFLGHQINLTMTRDRVLALTPLTEQNRGDILGAVMVLFRGLDGGIDHYKVMTVRTRILAIGKDGPVVNQVTPNRDFLTGITGVHISNYFKDGERIADALVPYVYKECADIAFIMKARFGLMNEKVNPVKVADGKETELKLTKHLIVSHEGLETRAAEGANLPSRANRTQAAKSTTQAPSFGEKIMPKNVNLD